MNIFAIADLHLSASGEKPMDVFGGNWEGHFEKIKRDWLEKVKSEDVVLIAGDISWAMKLDDALRDLALLADLPGKKVFVRGNHDYWWNGITKLRDRAPNDSFYFLQTDSVKIGNYLFVGSRGWTCPGSPDFTAEDEKIYLREGERFRLALQSAKKDAGEEELVALIHFPPFNGKGESSVFTDLFEQYGVKKVVFGHLHGASYCPYKTEKAGVSYFLTSCDKVGFSLVKIV